MFLVLCGLAAETSAASAESLRAAETAFATAFADRDQTRFASFIAEEAIFFGESRVMRGRAAVLEGWKALLESPTPPFSWAPERVEVLDSGSLGLSSGPVYDPAGKRIGTFVSTWRRRADGSWEIVLDLRCPPCGER